MHTAQIFTAKGLTFVCHAIPHRKVVAAVIHRYGAVPNCERCHLVVWRLGDDNNRAAIRKIF